MQSLWRAEYPSCLSRLLPAERRLKCISIGILDFRTRGFRIYFQSGILARLLRLFGFQVQQLHWARLATTIFAARSFGSRDHTMNHGHSLFTTSNGRAIIMRWNKRSWRVTESKPRLNISIYHKRPQLWRCRNMGMNSFRVFRVDTWSSVGVTRVTAAGHGTPSRFFKREVWKKHFCYCKF